MIEKGRAYFRVIRAPVCARYARAHAERRVGSLRRECLNRLLIFGRRLLECALAATRSTTTRTGHSASDLLPRRAHHEGKPNVIPIDRIRRHDRLGGRIHEYHLAA